MKTVEVNNTKVVLYSSIKELPLSRYKVMQNYILQDSGIGNDMAAIDKHLQNTVVLLGKERISESKTELTNLRYAFYSMINGIGYKTKSFACIVKQIGNVICDDISTEGLNATIEVLTTLHINNEEIDVLWDDVKKNLIPN